VFFKLNRTTRTKFPIAILYVQVSFFSPSPNKYSRVELAYHPALEAILGSIGKFLLSRLVRVRMMLAAK
jgi:hypothetical protein